LAVYKVLCEPFPRIIISNNPAASNMPSPATPIPAPKRLSKDLAARILDRAANLDAAEENVDVATLRAAAYDAGISPEAFERALIEAAGSVRATNAAVRSRANAYEVATKALWVGLVTGTLAFSLAVVIFGTPDEDAIAGALIAGGGALAGVFVHLLRKFRDRNR
jgi:hypothetical protein